jgi:hypothetical protein
MLPKDAEFAAYSESIKKYPKKLTQKSVIFHLLRVVLRAKVLGPLTSSG